VQALTRRWDGIGTAFHDGNAQIITAANHLWRDQRAELTRQMGWPTPGEGPDIVDYLQQARHARQRTGPPHGADPAGQHEPGDILSGTGFTALAGLDTYAFRLDWPAGLRLFEIDQPPVLRFKDTVLRDTGAQARCDRTVVAVDLR
jgi:hypothetical protein